ncbi:MAG: hypothetical protein M3O62_01985 [Pseudomonadota bacterium]|nr:hypothetical protein [Pseudomonadota bacterium]
MSNGTRHPLILVGLLAVLSVCGLVAMLLSDSAPWDRTALLLTALPLIVGAWHVGRPLIRRER